jgi:type VI secretion system protein
MLNTRLGEAVTVPDYGIEDLSDLTDSFPKAQESWRASIRATIENYEPRLTQVRVRLRPSENPFIISFEILAHLTFDENRGPLTLQTEVDHTGRFEVW